MMPEPPFTLPVAQVWQRMYSTLLLLSRALPTAPSAERWSALTQTGMTALYPACATPPNNMTAPTSPNAGNRRLMTSASNTKPIPCELVLKVPALALAYVRDLWNPSQAGRENCIATPAAELHAFKKPTTIGCGRSA